MAEKVESGNSMGCLRALLVLGSMAAVALSVVVEIASWFLTFDFPFLWVFGPSLLVLIVSTASSGKAGDANLERAPQNSVEVTPEIYEKDVIAISSASVLPPLSQSDYSARSSPSRHVRAAVGAPRHTSRHRTYISSTGKTYKIPVDRNEDPVTPNWFSVHEYESLERRPGHHPYISSTERIYYRPGSPRFATWQQAEINAQQWMMTHGYPGARLTPPGPDGGVDIFSDRAIAQVKNCQNPVGPGPVHELADLTVYSKYRGRQAVFFSTAGYTTEALSCGRERDVRLYERDFLRQRWVRVV